MLPYWLPLKYPCLYDIHQSMGKCKVPHHIFDIEKPCLYGSKIKCPCLFLDLSKLLIHCHPMNRE